jgi:hypothetical protein
MAVEGSMSVAAVGSAEATEALNRGLRALQDGLRLPGLETALASGGLPQALSEALLRWWTAYEGYLQIVGDSLDIRCGAGCAHCCHDNPRGLSGVELLWLEQGIHDHPQQDELRSRIAYIAKRFQSRIDEHGDESRAQREGKIARQPCPLLDENQRCSVYAHRPVEHPRAGEAVNPHLKPARVLRQLLQALSHRLGLQGLPGDLARGLVALEGHDGADSKKSD